jgi:iron complex outermembrane receptor protein
MRTRNLHLQICVHGVLAFAAFSAVGEEAEKASQLEEVIVTAERRAESLQDVSLSITAYDDKLRDRLGLQTIQDLVSFAPGVSYNTSTDRPSIRGIARQTNLVTIESPVANYFDGVYTSSVQDAGRRPIFVERTEVLRGPQGALSGRGSIAGAINTISKLPRDTFGAEVRSFAGSYSRYGVEATMTGPVTSWLRLRANYGTYHQDEGYFENISTGGSEGDQPNNRNIKDLLASIDLGESVDLFLKASYADYNESRRTGFSTAPFVAGTLNAPTPYGVTTGTLTPSAAFGYFSPGATRVGTALQNPVLTTGDERKFVSDMQSRQKLDGQYNYTAGLTWRAPSVDIRWTGGLQNYTYQQWTDGDGTDVLTLTLPPGPFPGSVARTVSPGQINYYMEARKYYSNELTFTSTNDSAFSWVAGLYQSNEKDDQEPATTILPGYDELNTPFGTSDTLLQILRQPGFNPANLRSVVANPRPNRSTVALIETEVESRAAFGQVSYDFNDQWQVTAGLRYNEDSKTATEQLRLIANALGGGLGPFLAGGGTLPPFPGVVAPTGPRSVDVTPIPTPGAPLPDGVIRDRGIDPVTGYRIRDFDKSWNAVTGSVGVDFKPRDQDLLYLRFAKGFRPGGFNTGSINSLPTVNEEKVLSYELGYKTTLFDRLRLSSSLFYYDYTDIQLPLPTLARCTDPADLSTCQSINTFVNLPTGESKGFELEANWAVTDNLDVYFSYGRLEAKIKDGISNNNGFSNPDDPAAVLRNANPFAMIVGAGNRPQLDTNFTFLPRFTQDLSGNSLANSPENRVALNTSYTFNFNTGRLILSGSYIWSDEAFSDVFETEEAKIPSFRTVGLRALWLGANDRYVVILYGSNLTDELALDGAGLTRLRTGAASMSNPSAAGAAYFRTFNLTPPREYGLELQYRFGGGR